MMIDTDPLGSRTGPSFGVTLTPTLIHHINPLADQTAPPLPSPEQTGTISAASIDLFYAITSYAKIKWALSVDATLDPTVFTNFINNKTQISPSYFTAYLQTEALYYTLVQQLGSADKAMNYLYTPNPSTPPENWDVIRNWAIKEFLILFIICGNFKAYGWLNFPGWMGSGPFNDPNHLPYRGINNGQ